MAAVKVLACIISTHLILSWLLSFTHILMSDLQEVDAASARRWSDPDKAEAGGRLVADMGSDHTANKLGSTKLPL